MLLRDIIVPGQGRGDLRLSAGRVCALDPAPPTKTPRIVIPALIEAHCHLDKCHTLHRLSDVGGDLAAAIETQRRDKANWTAGDIRQRARRGLADLRANGCGLVRSHVDWSFDASAPLAWSVLAELAQENDDLALTLSALVGLERMAEPDFVTQVIPAIKSAGGALGALALQHPDPRPALHAMFANAERHGLPLDFHVDETLAPGPCTVEAIADVALETRFDGPVLLGHACALMNLLPSDFDRVADKLARARIHVAALPTTNLYLQGRNAGTPDRRGLTRLRELHAAGVPVVVGSDNVEDAFCPVGQHDPMSALHLAILAAHLDPPLDTWLPLVTDNAATALGRAPIQVIGAAASDLRISDATSVADLISGRSGLLRPLSKCLEDAA